MKVLLISEETLNKTFEDLLKSLKIENLECKAAREISGQPPIYVDYDLHRKFVHELYCFKDALLKAKL